MKIFKEKPGVISKEAAWVCKNNEYTYTGGNILKLLWSMLTGWNSDKNLVG